MIMRGNWLIPGKPCTPSSKIDFDVALGEADHDLAAKIEVEGAFTLVPATKAKKTTTTRSIVSPKKVKKRRQQKRETTMA